MQNKPIEVIRPFINDLREFCASFSKKMNASSGRSIKEFTIDSSGERAPVVAYHHRALGERSKRPRRITYLIDLAAVTSDTARMIKASLQPFLTMLP